jgi:hypothetical protein
MRSFIQNEQETGEHRVGNHDEQDSADYGTGGGLTHGARTGFSVETPQTGYPRDDDAEDKPFSLSRKRYL